MSIGESDSQLPQDAAEPHHKHYQRRKEKPAAEVPQRVRINVIVEEHICTSGLGMHGTEYKYADGTLVIRCDTCDKSLHEYGKGTGIKVHE